VSEAIYVLLAVALVVAYLLLTSGEGSSSHRGRGRELDDLFEQTAREMVRVEERHRRWVTEALRRDRDS
jgi:hypothetical protein